MSGAAAEELAKRFTRAVVGLNPDRVVHAVLLDAVENLVAHVKADPPAVARAVKGARAAGQASQASLAGRASLAGGATPLPLAYFGEPEEAGFLTGAAGAEPDGAPFPATANLDVARFGLGMTGGADGVKKISLPRDVVKALRGAPGARETLADALDYLAHEVRSVGAITKAAVRKSALKKILSKPPPPPPPPPPAR